MNKRSNGVVALGLLAITVLAGCGGGASSTAPEDTVPPAPVVDVEAHGVDGPYPSVTVTWVAGSEADLDVYHIYRSTQGGPAVFLADVAQDPRHRRHGRLYSWRDDAVVTGLQHVYLVSAVDLATNESPRSSSSVVVVLGTGKDELD